METDIIAKILEWFKRAVPEPTDKNRAVQYGCNLEEVAETAEALYDSTTADALHQRGELFKKHSLGLRVDADPGQRQLLLDALCDQIVTAVGVAHMHGLDIVTGLHRVNNSNWSKFVDGQPVFDENGKIKKGHNFYHPDLSDLVG